MLKRIYLFFFLKISRNYNKVIKNDKLYQIRKLKSDLANYHFENVKIKYNDQFEISVRQYLFQKLLGQFFLKHLFFFINSKKIFFPIPNEWHKVFEKNSFKVNWLSNFLFKFFLIFKIIKGIFLIFKILGEYLYKNNKFEKYNPNDIVIYNLPPKRLNYSTLDPKKKNIQYWLHKKFPKNKFLFITNTNKNIKISDLKCFNYFYSNLINDLNLINFLKLSIKVILKSFYNLLVNNWSKVLLTDEIIKQKLIQSIKIDKKNFPKKNIFFYTGNIYKPLWVYELEKYSDFDLYLTSELSDLELKNDNFFKNHNFRGYNLISWKNIYVWTKKNYLEFKNFIPSSNIYISDPISITDEETKINFENRNISVFSYDLVRGYFGISQQIDYLSNLENQNNKFFEDIIFLSQKYKFNLLIKNKAKNSKYVFKKNLLFMQKISQIKNIQLIEPETSPHRIIEDSEAVISLPYTSTYFIGKYYSKSSIYYDPINLLKKQKNNNLIQSFLELEEWFKNLDENLKENEN